MMKMLKVEFDTNINNVSLADRKYTLTHSDETGLRYLFVGAGFRKERCNNLKDEVLGNWSEINDQRELHISCSLYSEYSSLTLEERYDKFKSHMPRAITAIIYGDLEYIITNRLLDKAVCVHFLSDYMPSHEYYGRVNDYIVN